MFGYVVINRDSLSERERERYQAYYCGLCDGLRRSYGEVGQSTLSYDMTLLWIVLSGLYEPEERECVRRCVLHPVKRRARLQNELCDYAADMNILLTYHKLLDDARDDHSKTARAKARLLKSAYDTARARHAVKCAVIEGCLAEISRIEAGQAQSADRLANLTGRMLGEIYAYRADEWADTLREMGEALGRFIYFMDAYDDYAQDEKKGRFNPLTPYRAQADYEEFILGVLTMMMSQCAQAFERLPILRDAGILRNILYSGVWARYAALKKQREQAEKEQTNEP